MMPPTKGLALLLPALVLALFSAVPVSAVETNAPPRTPRTAPTFNQLDADGNGVVTRAEWLGKPEAFNRRDTNQDGTLSRQEMERRVNYQGSWDDLMYKR